MPFLYCYLNFKTATVRAYDEKVQAFNETQNTKSSSPVSEVSKYNVKAPPLILHNSTSPTGNPRLAFDDTPPMFFFSF